MLRIATLMVCVSALAVNGLIVSAQTATQPAIPLFVNATDFGASPDAADNTDAIQKALGTAAKVVVPPGTYAVNGTINIYGNRRLHLSHGAWLKRFADRTDNTRPVVRLAGNMAMLTGDGPGCGVTSQNASGGHTGDEIIYNGVVNVGPVKADRYTNINFWVIDSITIAGSTTAWKAWTAEPHDPAVEKNELLTLVNSARLSAKRGSCYNGRVANCFFRHGGIAIKLNPVCNGNMFSNNLFFRISHSCYFANHATENIFSNCFVHASPGVTVIRLRDTGYNHFYGVMAEPGPTGPNRRYTRFCDISEDCSNNVIIGHGNTGHSYINKSKTSLILTHASLRHGRTATFGGIKTRDLEIVDPDAEKKPKDTGTKIDDVFIKGFKPTKPTQFHDAFTLTSTSPNQVFMVEISVTSGYPNTSNHSGAAFIISGKTGSGNEITASVDRIGGNEDLGCQALTEKNTVTVQLKPSYYHHGRFVIMLRAKGSGNFEIKND